jgi:hypothetical protein
MDPYRQQATRKYCGPTAPNSPHFCCQHAASNATGTSPVFVYSGWQHRLEIEATWALEVAARLSRNICLQLQRFSSWGKGGGPSTYALPSGWFCCTAAVPADAMMLELGVAAGAVFSHTRHSALCTWLGLRGALPSGVGVLRVRDLLGQLSPYALPLCEVHKGLHWLRVVCCGYLVR